ncbi:MAG: hypothetical protein GYA24_06800 [Candidatus Lokiarchaeota archaeon]|nr:hypothetical protein [Candidatus Lokiarchaeota archaeon]
MMHGRAVLAYHADVGPLLDATDLHEPHTMNIQGQASSVAALTGNKVRAIFDGHGAHAR